MRRTHIHRDIWVPLSVGLLVLAGGTPTGVWVAQATGPSAHISLWPNPFIVAAIAVFIAGLYGVLALIFGWWLPGGMNPEPVSTSATDEEVGRECLLLAQSMWELVANARRDQPGYSVEIPDNPADHHKAWQASVTAHRLHENKTIALFLERFGVRLSGVLQALASKGYLTEEEARSLWFKTTTIDWLDEIPKTLAARGHELGGRI